MVPSTMFNCTFFLVDVANEEKVGFDRHEATRPVDGLETKADADEAAPKMKRRDARVILFSTVE